MSGWDNRIRHVEIALTPEEVSANTTEEQTFTVPGLRTDDLVVVNKPTHQAGLVVASCRVSAVETLAITFGNLTGSGITPTAAETYSIVVISKQP